MHGVYDSAGDSQSVVGIPASSEAGFLRHLEFLRTVFVFDRMEFLSGIDERAEKNQRETKRREEAKRSDCNP